MSIFAENVFFSRKINVWHLCDPQGAQERSGVPPTTYQPYNDTLQSKKHSLRDLPLAMDPKSTFSLQISSRHKSILRHSNQQKCVFFLEKSMFGTYSTRKGPRNVPEHSQSLSNHVRILCNPENTLCMICHAYRSLNPS